MFDRYKWRTAIAYGLFFLSGLAGLAYEVSWTRQIGVLFGQTVQSASIVLASYFFGMAIGYMLGSRLLGKVHPLIGYAICEVVVGAWAFLLPPLLGLFSLPSIAALLNSPTIEIQTFIRGVVGLAALLPATVALGATLPYMADYVSRHAEVTGTRVTTAYALNVAGAFLGVVSATMIGIVQVGVVGTSYVAALLSFLCATSAFSLSKREEIGFEVRPIRQSTEVAWRWLGMAVLSGFGILALQVLFMRLFSLVLHNSVYSFGAIVAAFLVALAVGSLLVRWFSRRTQPESGMLAVSQSGGVAIMAALLFFLYRTELDYFESGVGFYDYLAGVFGFAGLVLFLPVTLLGVLLPWVWIAASANDNDIVSNLGRLTAANTIAASIGAITASFLLLPTVGLFNGFAAIALAFILFPLCAFRSARTLSNVATTIAACVFCLASVIVASRYDGLADDEKLIKRWESAYGWVDVVEFAKSKALQLRQNIHYGLGSTGSVTMERRQAHLPILLHPDPKKVLFIGLATGITAGGALDHDAVKNVDVVELIPDVVEAASRFAAFNRNVTEDARVNILVNDGRHFLSASTELYDVIISDLFVPWESHTGYLYTRENYEAVERRLTGGGIFCQWIPLWQLGERELTMIIDTFAHVFDRTSLWFGKIHEHWTILGIVGSKDAIELRNDRLTAILDNAPQVSNRDRSWFASPEELFLNYIGDWPRREGSVLNTDEHPLIEFYTPITAWTRGKRLKYDELVAFADRRLFTLSRENITWDKSNPAFVEKYQKKQRELLTKEKD